VCLAASDEKPPQQQLQSSKLQAAPLGRLWTAADFASASNSPAGAEAAYSPMENMISNQNSSPEFLGVSDAFLAPDAEQQAVTPELSRQFRAMANEMYAAA